MLDLSLYVILDPAQCAGRSTKSAAEAAIMGGATLLQYRDKTASTRAMVENAAVILKMAKRHGVPLLVNDRVDVALAVKADGVHLGQDDMPIDMARAMLGEDAIIGLTLKTAQDIDTAPIELIDYGCIGGVFATKSKQNETEPLGLNGLHAMIDHVRRLDGDLPLDAIAGIDAANAASVIGAGANGIAVLSAVTKANDPKSAAAELKSIVMSAKRGRAA